ncbi:MAG: hypothetical protein R3300_01485 [Candidatus Promineifilaceae bacterium]|nr:hypothetical protein [Candidatus Promineifilaceae bacterium]
MTGQDWLILLGFAIEAVFWIGAYVLVIRHAFRDKIHAMPVVAMCGNIGWEFILGLGLFPACPVYWPNCPDAIMGPATLAAALLDAFILYTIIRFGREQFRWIPWLYRYFPVFVLAGAAIGFTVVFRVMSDMYTVNVFEAAVNGEVPAFLQAGLQGGLYTGWGLALMMGVLFIALITSRDNVQGQSFYIALFMMLGNVGAFLFDIFATISLPGLLYVLVVVSLTLNLIYAIMVYRKSQALGLDPLRRW